MLKFAPFIAFVQKSVVKAKVASYIAGDRAC
jgi:hypothetical protein